MGGLPLTLWIGTNVFVREESHDIDSQHISRAIDAVTYDNIEGYIYYDLSIKWPPKMYDCLQARMLRDTLNHAFTVE